ncbi:T9SS type A sorting domain-containing protein [Fulvivirga sp. M361]|uniref:T9SS type A sorting domain-containing protein n=1 Tax=Fulvivirga sp. M361 TaxID=2594266 RepID=UPI001179C5C3|nr:T9SS type A sorting domain-containing protein [Fulvivirga sp. M361]TRX48906.1 T9SS type A sorting domain-containing protein [Fulvivirga sp. M361]
MKTKTHFLALLLTVLSIAAHGTGKEKEVKTSSVKVVKRSETYQLFYLEKSSKKVSVRIFDGAGKLIFSERISNENGFIRPYNFSGLSDGLYNIVITDGNSRIIKQVNHHHLSELRPGRLSLVKVDEVEGENRVYKVTIVNQGTGKAKINVLNANKEVVYTVWENLEGNYAKLFNLKRVSGDTSIEVAVNGETSVFDL